MTSKSKFKQLLKAEEEAEQAIRLYIREFMLSTWRLAENEVKSTKIFNYNVLEQNFMVQIFYSNGRTEAFSHSFYDVERWEKSSKTTTNKE